MNKKSVDFYVYLHKRKTDGRVFYVGKGTSNRAWTSYSRSKFWKSIVDKHGLIVEIVSSDLQEWAAFELEASLIALYGRKDSGLGYLCNHSDGGEGNSNPSTECRSKVSFAQIQRMRSGKHQFLSKEGKEAQRNAVLGELNPSKRIEVREKISKTKLGDLNPMSGRFGANHPKSRSVICVTNNKRFESLTQAAHWIKSISGSASYGQITKIGMACRGARNSAYGHKWQWADSQPFELEIT